MATTTRLVRIDDGAELAELVRANRAFHAPWDPLRSEDFFTVGGQRDSIAQLLRAHADRAALPLVILQGERIVGRMTLTHIVRGVLQSANVGYWLNEADTGRGHASVALAEMCEIAFGELGLHRVEAGTLVANVRSQAVLRRCGFTRFGLAPGYLRIAGRWQDHVMFQRLSDLER